MPFWGIAVLHEVRPYSGHYIYYIKNAKCLEDCENCRNFAAKMIKNVLKICYIRRRKC